MNSQKLAWAIVAGLAASSCRGCTEPDEEAAPQPSSSEPITGWVEPPGGQVSLATLVRAARRGSEGVWRQPSSEELDRYGDWVAGIASAGWSDRLPSKAPPPGFTARLAESGDLWLLMEAPGHKRGAGIVVVRPSYGAPVIAEAPHSFFDSGTLDLSLLAFDVLQAKALLINTIHRGGSGTKEQRRKRALSGESEMDVAHSQSTFLARAHARLAALQTDLVAVQLHGFADERLPGVRVVVSAARTKADARAAADALAVVLGRVAVRLYPDEVDLLGGTTNAQARASRKVGAGFLHLEMSATLRRELRADTALATRFMRAVGSAVVKR